MLPLYCAVIGCVPSASEEIVNDAWPELKATVASVAVPWRIVPGSPAFFAVARSVWILTGLPSRAQAP